MRIANSDLQHEIDVHQGSVTMEIIPGSSDTKTSVVKVTDPDKGASIKKKSKASEQRMIRHIGEDPSRLIAELTPGKKGGDYELPFGGRLSVPAGLLGKKDVVTCCMMSPSDRYKYLPPIRNNEHLLSEVFLLATSLKSIKGSMNLKLPYYEENMALFDIDLLWKKVDGEDWNGKEFEFSKKGRFVEFPVDSGGIFVVISKPKCETFAIPVQGCLYNSKLSHQVSVRFPKKATGIDLLCDLVISPVNRENLPNLYRDYPRDMDDLVALSDYVTIQANIPTTFKRAVTVKLPLPLLDTDHFDEEDMAVVSMTTEGWQLLDSPLKFTKSAVMFDTKVLSKYCVALSKPKRKRRLVNSFKHLQEEEDSRRGKILAFLHLQEKLWTLWVEVSKEDDVKHCIQKREEQGFRKIQVVDVPLVEEKVPFRRNWKTQKTEAAVDKPKRDGVDLIEGQVFEFDLSGDIKLCSESSVNSFLGVHYHDRLKENYKRVFVEPIANGGEKSGDLSGRLLVHRTDPITEEKTCSQVFEMCVSGEEVETYFYIRPPTPEPEPQPEPQAEALVDEVAVTPRVATSRPPTASFLRLITPIKPPRKVQKEAKVLTGKSLTCLAREIEQGLTLAIHLDISDSTITGMGFDALANGLNLKDITYRILLMWKRKTNRFKDRQVDLLISALQEMGRNDVATIVSDSHKQNKELTPASFEMPLFTSDIIINGLPQKASDVIL